MPVVIIFACFFLLALVFAVLRLSDRKRENKGGGLDVISVILVSIVLAVIAVLVWGFFFVTPDSPPSGVAIFAFLALAVSFFISFAIGLVFVLPDPKSKLSNDNAGDEKT